MKRVHSQRRAALATCMLLAACRASTPVVPSGPHPPGVEGVRVGFPPPPARVEALPLQRRDECVWRDGHWEWERPNWQWVPGAWVISPPGCYYAPPRVEWTRRGGTSQLTYWRPRWYPDPDEKQVGQEQCAEPRACTSLLPESSRPAVPGAKPPDGPDDSAPSTD